MSYTVLRVISLVIDLPSSLMLRTSWLLIVMLPIGVVAARAARASFIVLVKRLGRASR